ncbi:hypothetical protein NIES2104_34830 [Leptolyngbya sp. NIES-2104]|nr:hypothetical protein NIES2104_34830 [Leptolyngbya sp. NIES-2104]
MTYELHDWLRQAPKDRILVSNHCHCSICRKVRGAAFGTFGHQKDG